MVLMNLIYYVRQIVKKIGIFGENGTGKSTLIKIIVGEILGKLSIIANKDEKYLKLEEQFNILLKEKSILIDKIKNK